MKIKFLAEEYEGRAALAVSLEGAEVEHGQIRNAVMFPLTPSDDIVNSITALRSLAGWIERKTKAVE